MNTSHQRAMALCAILALGAAAATKAQSSFPVRFEPAAATAATGVEVVGAVTIAEARHYSKHFSYDVDPGALNKSVAVVAIDGTTDDTVVTIRVRAATTDTSGSGLGSSRQQVIKGRYDAGSDTWQFDFRDLEPALYRYNATIGLARLPGTVDTRPAQ